MVLHILVRRGNPGYPITVHGDLAWQAFNKTFTPKRLRQHIQLLVSGMLPEERVAKILFLQHHAGHHQCDPPGCAARYRWSYASWLEMTNVQLMSMTDLRTAIKGKRQLRIQLARHPVVQEVKLANIANLCIIGLELLT